MKATTCPICKAPTERLREALDEALDLCRSLLRFGPGGAAGAGMMESLEKLSKEARSL